MDEIFIDGEIYTCKNTDKLICTNLRYICLLHETCILYHKILCPLCKSPMEISDNLFWCNNCLCGWNAKTYKYQ